MKNFRFILIFLILLFNTIIAEAYKYSETDKNMFYEAFLDGYFTEMEKAVNKLDIEQEKKEKFIVAIKRQTNKQELINSSWDCIQKYPLQQIVAASVICTSDWTNKQAKKNKELFEILK